MYTMKFFRLGKAASRAHCRLQIFALAHILHKISISLTHYIQETKKILKTCGIFWPSLIPSFSINDYYITSFTTLLSTSSKYVFLYIIYACLMSISSMLMLSWKFSFKKIEFEIIFWKCYFFPIILSPL